MPGKIFPHMRSGNRSFKENVLFRGYSDYARYNACVGNNGGPYDLFDYAHGYFEATRLLLDGAMAPADQNKSRLIIDTLVYPICLNFRHAIELYIKYLITDLAKAAKSWKSFKVGHSLSDNWKTAQKLIKSSGLKATNKEIELMDTAVKCIMEVDPNGGTFRYPESIKGNQHLKEWSLINLIVLETYRTELYEAAYSWHGKLEALFGR
jgi:hypothetical protein